MSDSFEFINRKFGLTAAPGVRVRTSRGQYGTVISAGFNHARAESGIRVLLDDVPQRPRSFYPLDLTYRPADDAGQPRSGK